jgi:uroporphyrinogen decarboxylase
MEKNERLKKLIAGEAIDRLPFALWRHLPSADATPEGLVHATVQFIRRWDFDLVKVMFLNKTWSIDWGGRFQPYDRGGGWFPIEEPVIKQPGDWPGIRPLPPTRGVFADQVRVVKMLRHEFGPHMPIVATMFSPLTAGLELAGPTLHEHALTHGTDVHAGLRILTETIGDFAQACVEAGADGIFLAVQSAREDALSAEAFEEFGVAYDLQILKRVESRTWFNVLHLCKPKMRFETVKRYPVQAVNWHDRGATGPSLAEARKIWSGVFIAGLDHEGGGAFVKGVPDEAAAQARDAIEQVEGKQLILGPGCVTHLGTPEANIDAVRQVVNGYAVK